MTRVPINYRRDVPRRFSDAQVPFVFLHQFEVEASPGSDTDLDVVLHIEKKPSMGFCLSLDEALALSQALQQAVRDRLSGTPETE